MGTARIYASVKLDAIGANIDRVRASIPESTKIMAVIKANAYGHGAIKIAQYLKNRADYFGVATVDEGCELRQHGITTPILVLGCVDRGEFYAAVKNDIDIAMFDHEDACVLSAVAAELSKNAGIHIKVDTGMGRIGYAPNKTSADEISKISQLTNIEIKGIFSHYACADSADKKSACEQREIFHSFVNSLENTGVEVGIKHIDNSAGIMEMDSAYDMVRMGIMLYGLYPSEEMNRAYPLVPAMELKSRVSYVKDVEKGSGISYSHTFIAKKAMRIATVPVGYADGYPRALSNVGHVLIKGMRCPIVGRICMDQMMVDVTGLDVFRGDEVVLVGQQGKAYISVEEVAEAAGSFNYEFICAVSRRVPRLYFEGDQYVDDVSYILI